MKYSFISSMELRNGRMEIPSKVNSLKGKNKDKENFFGMIIRSIISI